MPRHLGSTFCNSSKVFGIGPFLHQGVRDQNNPTLMQQNRHPRGPCFGCGVKNGVDPLQSMGRFSGRARHKPITMPIATAQVEELIDELRENYSVVIVTHSMQQAARVSQKTAFFHLGNLVEFGDTGQIFTNPSDPRTESYITGRIG